MSVIYDMAVQGDIMDEEEEEALQALCDVRRVLRWGPMALFLRFGAPLIGVIYLVYAALLVHRGDLVLEVWFLPW